MSKNTLGQVLREHRYAMGLTQRRLAGLVGVKASHIAFIENAKRRPSLALLTRISERLGLDHREMLFLAYPEVKSLLRLSSQSERSKSRGNSWRRFIADRALHSRHNITRAELRLLKQVSLLENISCPRHFLFILNSIRLAGDRKP